MESMEETHLEEIVSAETNTEEKHWFVAKTKTRQEKKIRQQLEELGVEVYLPTSVEMRQWHDRKKKVEMVLIPSTIFIHSTQEQALSLPNDRGIQIHYAIDTMDGKRRMMTVSNKEMDNFMRFLDYSDEPVSIENDLMYKKGTKVEITKGPWCGIEGELVRVDSKKKVVVRLTGVITCTLEIPMGYLRKME